MTNPDPAARPEAAVLMPGAVFIGGGSAFALLWATNFKTQWVFRWSDGIKEWISMTPYIGQPLGERITPAEAKLYGVSDDGRAVP